MNLLALAAVLGCDNLLWPASLDPFGAGCTSLAASALGFALAAGALKRVPARLRGALGLTLSLVSVAQILL